MSGLGRHRAPGALATWLRRIRGFVLFLTAIGAGGTALSGVVFLASGTVQGSRPRPEALNIVPPDSIAPTSPAPAPTVTPSAPPERVAPKPRRASPAPAPRRIPMAFLSDLPFSKAANGLGPVERDASNGEADRRDGDPLTIQGRRFDHGIGVRAPSFIRFDLDRSCTRVTAQLGLDDEEDRENVNTGAVRFIVRAGGETVFRSPVVTPRTPPIPVDVRFPPTRRLELIVDPLDNGLDDHADWADAKIWCPPGTDA